MPQAVVTSCRRLSRRGVAGGVQAAARLRRNGRAPCAARLRRSAVWPPGRPCGNRAPRRCVPAAARARSRAGPRRESAPTIPGPVGLRASHLWDLVPGEIVVVTPRKQWRYAGHPYLSGEIASTRLDVAALGLVPRRLDDRGAWNPGRVVPLPLTISPRRWHRRRPMRSASG